VGIPFRRLEEYAAGARPLSPADRVTLAAFFAVAPESLSVAGQGAPPGPAIVRRGKVVAPLPALVPERPPRPAEVPAPSAIVTSAGSAVVRASGLLQRPPAPEGKGTDTARATFWLLELLVPHQPLRGEPHHPPILVQCAVRSHQLDPFRWLVPGDRVVVSGPPLPRPGLLYIPAEDLTTPRAERLAALLTDLDRGDPAAPAALEKLLGPDWESLRRPAPGTGRQHERPPWAPPPQPVQGPAGRLQVTLQGQLQADPRMELDDDGGGTAELRLEIAPPRPDARMPVARYRAELRPRALRGLGWLQRGDIVTVSGDIVRLGDELLVEASTLGA
jgi:hypothetical protein